MSVIKHLAAGAALALLFTLSVAYPARAQGSGDAESQHQLNLKAARADRKAIVGENMNLTPDQAKAFWPVYNAYEAKMDKLDDQHFAEIKDYAAHYQTLTDDDATKKLDAVMQLRQERLDVQKEFIPKFRAVVSPILTARFFQIDNKLNAMVQYQIAKIVPLAGMAGSQ
jgi:hypothetical protein